jgi:hypothetical protein
MLFFDRVVGGETFETRQKEEVMRKILIALAVGTIIGLAPMFAEQADAQRFGGRGGGIGRIGGGPGGIGRVGGGIGRVGVARVGGIGRVGIGRAGWGGGIGRVGVARVGGIGRVGIGRVGWGPRIGAVGLGARRVAWGGWPGWRVRRAAFWGLGVPLAVGAIGYGYGYGSGSCVAWDPYYGYVNVCYTSYYGGYGSGAYGGQYW